MRVEIDLGAARDAAALHAAFREALGFPEWYGANWDAWIDCVRSMADPAPLASRGLGPGEDLVIALALPRRPDEAQAGLVGTLASCAAGVVAQWGPGRSILIEPRESA